MFGWPSKLNPKYAIRNIAVIPKYAVRIFAVDPKHAIR